MQQSFFSLLNKNYRKQNNVFLTFYHHNQKINVSYASFWNLVQVITLGLKELGIKKGENVGLIASNSPYWLVMDLAIMSIGACSVPLFEDIAEDNLAFEVEVAQIKKVFIDSQDIWDKLGNKKKLFKQFIIKNIDTEIDEIINFEDLVSKGEGILANNKDSYGNILQELDSDSISTIIYTSGSSGQPKGVEISLNNLAYQLVGISQLFKLKDDKALSCLPLAHIFERIVVYYYLSCGISIDFINIRKVGNFINEVKPTLMTAVPRLLEKFYLRVNARVAESFGVKKKIGQWAINRASKREVGAKVTLLDKIYGKLVYDKIYQSLGGSLRMFVIGGAALNPNIERFFSSIGVAVYQGYGLTECSPIVASNYPNFNKPGTVGHLLSGVKVKIAEDGEVLIQSPSLMLGYYKNVQKTNEAIINNWFYTGDFGKLDEEGYLTITGRKKELFKTSNGKYVSPVYLENLLIQSGLVDHAIIIANNRQFVSCLLFVNEESYKETIYYKRYKVSLEEFYKDEKGSKLLERVIKEVNGSVNHWEQIRKYKLILEPLSIESGSLSTKMGIRRHILEEKYSSIIEDFYKI